jgi:hypothetical protein
VFKLSFALALPPVAELLLDWLVVAVAGVGVAAGVVVVLVVLEVAELGVALSPPELQPANASTQSSVENRITERIIVGRSIVGLPFEFASLTRFRKFIEPDHYTHFVLVVFPCQKRTTLDTSVVALYFHADGRPRAMYVDAHRMFDAVALFARLLQGYLSLIVS